jgi:hypothetical protein
MFEPPDPREVHSHLNTIDSNFQRPTLRLYLQAFATLGPGWTLARTSLVLLNRLRILELRTPCNSWSSFSLGRLLRPGVPTEIDLYYRWRFDNPGHFFFDDLLLQHATFFVAEEAVASAESILRGEFPYFGYTRPFGYPPHWQLSPEICSSSGSTHWSRIDEFAGEDIKLSWELSRFGWAYFLARAYARNRDERYAEAFWHLLLNWMAVNQPNCGVQWKCGQEASFRIMALCFALYVFHRSPATTPTRLEQLLVLLCTLAIRVDSYTEYSQLQRNNHAISEGTALWTVGLLFPEFKRSAHWRTKGRRIIESEVPRQIYTDGSYIQHSFNYHRVMLQDLLWSLRLGECNHASLSDQVYSRFAKSVSFLDSFTDPQSGWAPNTGANDGALVLPLSSCAFPDMRPALQSSFMLAEHRKLLADGPWNEEMIWMNGLQSIHAPAPQDRICPDTIAADIGGYYALHSQSSWALLRGARFRDRPSHADQLHLDLWWRGENVLCDPGTFSYNAEFPFHDGFASTRFHNTVDIGGTDQMTRLGRFLWSDWSKAEIIFSPTQSASVTILQAQHDGYKKMGILHRRLVLSLPSDTWVILDDVAGSGTHLARLHWLLPDVPFLIHSSHIYDFLFPSGNTRLTVASSAKSCLDLVRAGQRVDSGKGDPTDPARGWISRYYAAKSPALSLSAETRAQLPIRFITVLSLGKQLAVEFGPSLTALHVGHTCVGFSPCGDFPLSVQIG